MSEPLASSAAEQGRLHPLSWLFSMAGMLKELALPLIAFFILGRRDEAWAMWALIPLLALALWSALRVWVYRYELHPGELLIRDRRAGQNPAPCADRPHPQHPSAPQRLSPLAGRDRAAPGLRLRRPSPRRL